MEETPQNTNSYGLRYEDMSSEELEHYRQFWQTPTTEAVSPQLPEAQAVAARVRMATGLSFTLFTVGLLCTLIPLLTQNLIFALGGAALTAAGLGLLIAVRRRSFTSLRMEGQVPLEKNKKAVWFWLPHLLTLAGLATALVAIAVVPKLYSAAGPDMLRNHAALWTEITLMLWLMAALLYGLIALAVYTPDDHDEAIIRPTDYAEKQLEKDLARNRRGDDDFYDSGWISGR